jgi:predicted MFS family arabinose efflux permease
MYSSSAPSLPPTFKRLAWSNLAAQSAEQIGVAATPIVAVLALGAGAGETGLLQTLHTLPFLLFAIPAGLLADRSSRPRLMAVAEALRVASLIAIVALAMLGLLTLPLLALLGFIGACGTVAYSVAAPALVPSLVPAAALATANARIELARTVAFVAGPALAGALAGWTGGAPAFALAAALSVGAVVLLAGLREPPRQPTLSARRPWQELRQGVEFVFRHPLLRPVFLTQLLFNTAFFMLHAVYVPYAVHRLGLSATQVGVTLAAYGVGMVAGALLAPRVTRAVPFGTVIAIGPIIAACRIELLPDRRGSNPVGDQHHNAAPNRHPARPARPGLGHQHHGLRIAAGRRGDRRAGGRPLRRGDLPGGGGDRISSPGAGDPGIAGRPARAPAGDGLAAAAGSVSG